MAQDAAPDAGQAAREQEYVCRALEEAAMLVVGLDQVVATMRLTLPPDYSPLRTRLEQAKTKAETVLTFLRGRPAGG